MTREKMTQAQFDAWLDSSAAELPQSIEPQRDLWPAIARQIDAPESPAGQAVPVQHGPWLVALAATLMLGVAVAMLLRTPGPGLVQPESMPTSVQYQGELPAPWQPGITRVRNELQPDYEDGLARLAPKTRALVEDNLRQIHNSLAAIHTALAEDPGNLVLHRMLADTYQQELDLVSRIGSISKPETEL